MSDDNIIQFIPKQKVEEDVYERIYACLEAAYLGHEHNCSYCNHNDIIAKMLFEILINELVTTHKKTKLNFSTFDAKLILNKISERILKFEQAMVGQQQETGETRERQLRGITRTDQDLEETSSSTEETDRETTEKPIPTGKD